MNKELVSEDSASRPAIPDIYITTVNAVDAGEYSRPSDLHSTQLGDKDPDQDVHPGINSIGLSDWLTEATVNTKQDLDTSKKELDIINFILEEFALRSRTDRRPSITREGQIRLMRACQEHSSSRCHLLRDRLRHVQFWTRSKAMGQQVPGKAPEEVSNPFTARLLYSQHEPKGNGGIATGPFGATIF
ncbi:hypothetical protein NUW58_g7976 [Xylaria curta]|uniref:Uncharacterized protein n=1 Tax=Xylaria curta TaxID=42375 RepID=A0ACC1NC41_9PEZI|nr:hypothetical protein NUW58_g7976 [Xylaria curta]